MMDVWAWGPGVASLVSGAPSGFGLTANSEQNLSPIWAQVGFFEPIRLQVDPNLAQTGFATEGIDVELAESG